MDRVELVVELRGDQEALRKLQQLQNLVNQLNGKRITPTVDSSNADTALGKLKKSLGDLFNKDKTLKINAAEVDGAADSVKKLNDSINSLSTGGLESVDNTVKSISGNVGGLSAAFQSLSTLFSGIGGTMSTAGSWLRSLSGVFGGDVLGTAMRTTTGYATVLGIQGLGKSLERFDTFRTFPRMMAAMGFSSEEAERAIQRLNEAVLGTPTSLSDIMDIAKDFILLANDIDKGTDFAIAANNAFLANGSDAQQVYYGMRQLRDLFSKGGLREQEWDSLFSALGISIGVVGQELGYTADQVGEFKNALKEGDVDVNDFIDAIIRAGTGSGQLTNMVDVGKDTLNASITNLKTAFANLGATVLQEFDDILVETTGDGLPATIKKLSDAIKQDWIPAIKGWVGENGDQILEFIDRLVSFDWKKLGASIGDNALKLFETIGKILDMVGEDNIIKLVSFATVWAGPLGKALSLLGGLFNGIGGLFGRLGRASGGGSAGGSALGAIAVPGFIGLVTEVAFAMRELAEAGSAVSGADLDALAENLPKMKTIVLQAAAIAGVLTAGGAIVSAIPGAGLVVGGGELIAAGIIGVIGEIAVVLSKYADVLGSLSSLNDAELPSADKIGQFIAVLGTFQKGVNDNLLGATLDSKSVKTVESALNVLMTIIENQDVFAMLDDADVNFGSSAEKVAAMGEGLTEIVQALLDHFGENGGVRTIQQKGAIVKNIGNIITELDATTDKLHELRNSMHKLGISLNSEGDLDETSDFADLVNRIEALVQGLTDVSNAISDNELDALLKAIKTKLETDIIENYTDTVSDLQTLAKLTAELDMSELGLLEQNSPFNQLTAQIAVLLDGIGGVLSTLDAKLFEPSSWFGKKKTSDQSTMVKSIADAMDGILSIVTSTDQVLAAMQSMDFRKLDMMQRNIAALLDTVETIIYGIDVSGISNDSLNATTMYADAMAQIARLLLIVSEMGPVLSGISDSGTVTNLTNMLAGLGIAADQIPADMEDLTERVNSMADIVAQLGEMVSTVASMNEKMAAMQEKNVPAEVGGLLGQLSAMIGGFEGENVETNNFQILAESVKLLDETVFAFIDETLTLLLEKLQELTENIEYLTDPALENLNQKNKDVKKTTEDLTQAIEDLGDTAVTGADRVDTLRQSIEAAGGSAERSASVINSLAEAINSLQDKTITVSVLTEGLDAFNPLLPSSRGRANGGPIYRASGGSVFKPNGTDTVPAMLTPGEYVIRKSAVDRIGAPILAMLNKMDISGAIDALMAKVHTPFLGGYVDNRRSYDNHATVNQTIITNNPDYSYRRASRFAHAL